MTFVCFLYSSSTLSHIACLFFTARFFLLQELAEPSETFSITGLLGDGAHEDFNGSAIDFADLFASPGALRSQSIYISQFFFRSGILLINLVTEDNNGDLGEFGGGHKGFKFLFRFFKSVLVGSVDEINDTVNSREITLPGLSDSFMASEIVSSELDVTQNEFFSVSVDSGVLLDHSVVLESSQKSGFTSVVETKEKDLGVLLVKAKRVENTFEPIEEEHFMGFVLNQSVLEKIIYFLFVAFD